MINIDIALDRIEDLIDLAASARSGFEKAAVFSAIICLVKLTAAEAEKIDVHIEAELELIRWGICGCIGYDIRFGTTPADSLTMSIDTLRLLRMRLRK